MTAVYPLAHERGVMGPLFRTGAVPQYLPSADAMDDALHSAFAERAAQHQAAHRRASTVATWMCLDCRRWTRPSRGPSPDVCDEIACRRPRTAPRGRPAPGALE